MTQDKGGVFDNTPGSGAGRCSQNAGNDLEFNDTKDLEYILSLLQTTHTEKDFPYI